MNLVQSTLEGYLRQGFSQKEISDLLGMSAVQLNYVLHGKREASDKMLKSLGIDKQIVYTYVAGRRDPVLKPKARPKRVKQKSVQIEMPGIEPKAPAGLKPAQTHENLSTEAVSIAMRFKVNPRNSWATFCEASPSDRSLGAFEAHCASIGTQPTPVRTEPEQLFASVGHGGAVAIKIPAERADMRRPLKLGEIRTVVADSQPEVSA